MAQKYVDVSLDKTAYTLAGIHLLGVTTVTVNEAIVATVPQTGSIRIGGTPLAYTSWTGSTFTTATTVAEYPDLTVVNSGLNDGSSLANAWWSLLEVFLNTMAAGTVTAGDSINIRTHDGTNDLSETMLANITMVTPTSRDTPTEFIFDDGTVWGSGGVFKLSTLYKLIFSDYFNLYADGVNHRFNAEYNGTAAVFYIAAFDNSFIDGLHISQIGSNTALATTSNGSSNIILKDFLYEGQIYSGTYPPLAAPDYGSITLIDPVFDLTLDNRSVANAILIKYPNYGSRIKVIGGKIINGWDSIFPTNKNAREINCTFYGFDFNQSLLDFDTVYSSVDVSNGNSITVLDYPDQLDAIYNMGNVICEWRKTGLYPTLNAILPDGLDTSWSYKVTASNTSKGRPVDLPTVEKVYQQTTGVKTLTIEMLVNDNLDTTTMAGDLYCAFSYLDDVTGKVIVQYTYVKDGAISTSSAAWSATTYGSNPYSKFKLEVTTTGQVRSGTKIYAQVFCGIKRIVSTDFFFIDPDIGIT